MFCGTGSLINIDVTTLIVVWVVLIVIAGFGDGTYTNIPYSAIQAILDECEKP